MVFADIHCHALAYVDDGARDAHESKEMIDTAYDDGIRTICFTPHFKLFEFRNSNDIEEYNKRVLESFAASKKYAAENHPNMELFLGNEIMYHDSVADSVFASLCKSLNNTSYILVEFMPSAPYFEILHAVSSILRSGLIPIIAHVERYSELVKKPQRIYELKSLGALIQINAWSIKRFRIGKIAHFIKVILKKRLVDFISTDAHDAAALPPQMSLAYNTVEKLCDSDYAKKICNDNALNILHGNF